MAELVKWKHTWDSHFAVTRERSTGVEICHSFQHCDCFGIGESKRYHVTLSLLIISHVIENTSESTAV